MRKISIQSPKYNYGSYGLWNFTIIVEILIADFSGQLKGWWDNYLTKSEKSAILTAIKTYSDGNPILNGSEIILDVVNSLIFTIAQIPGDNKFCLNIQLYFLWSFL